MDVFEKINAQQGKERTAVWMVGEQLKDMIRDDPMAQEIVDRDLDIKEMGLEACEKKIKAFADGHRTGSFACVTPAEAERIIREFYGLPDAGSPAPSAGSKVIDLASFF